jgi:hypothetical protein
MASKPRSDYLNFMMSDTIAASHPATFVDWQVALEIRAVVAAWVALLGASLMSMRRERRWLGQFQQRAGRPCAY